MKALGPVAPDVADAERAVVELVAQEQPTTPKRKQGSERVMSCLPHCSHSASLPSDVLIELKVEEDVLLRYYFYLTSLSLIILPQMLETKFTTASH